VAEVRTQAGVAAAAITSRSAPGDVVVVCPDQLGPSLERLVPGAAGLDLVAFPELGTMRFVDWTDYADRNDPASNPGAAPEPVADALVQRAGPAGSVFLVFSPGYATHDTTCPALAGALGARRAQETLVVEDGSQYYEHATVNRYGPVAP
jgi:hypothetical protein